MKSYLFLSGLLLGTSISMSSLMADTHVVNASCNDARFGACTSTPSAITDAHVVNVPYNEANSHKNDVVRWGGRIVDIENEENHSLIEVQFHPLDESGHPQLDQPSEGEFVVKTSEFLDSETYWIKYSEITAVGTLNGYVNRVQGRWPYNDVLMPLIVVNDPQNLYTWEKDYWMRGLGGIDARGGIDSSYEPKGKTALLFKNVAGFIMTIPFCALAGLGKDGGACIGMFANSITKIYMDL